MPIAGAYSFTIEQGATFKRLVTWYDDEAATQRHNLTGYSARMKVKSGDLSAVILDTADITLTLGGASGTITIVVVATKTASLAATQKDALRYDLELVAGDGTVTRLLSGRVTVSAEVTS